jgi:hypothetical protein
MLLGFCKPIAGWIGDGPQRRFRSDLGLRTLHNCFFNRSFSVANGSRQLDAARILQKGNLDRRRNRLLYRGATFRQPGSRAKPNAACVYGWGGCRLSHKRRFKATLASPNRRVPILSTLELSSRVRAREELERNAVAALVWGIARVRSSSCRDMGSQRKQVRPGALIKDLCCHDEKRIARICRTATVQLALARGQPGR